MKITDIKTTCTGIKSTCKRIRVRLSRAALGRFDLNAVWIRNHIAQCPRCRHRFSDLGKVNLALSLIKSQPHRLDLLMRANSQAIGVLKHSLRNLPGTRQLKEMRPDLAWYQRLGRYTQPIVNAAACLAIAALLRFGIFSSMDSFQDHGRDVLRTYYTNHLGQEAADDIFTT